MCHCSKWEHIAHYTPKNQNTAKTNFRERARAHTHTQHVWFSSKIRVVLHLLTPTERRGASWNVCHIIPNGRNIVL